MDTHKILLSRREAANAISVSVRELDKLVAQELIAAVRVGRRVLVPVRDLERFATITSENQQAKYATPSRNETV